MHVGKRGECFFFHQGFMKRCKRLQTRCWQIVLMDINSSSGTIKI